MKLITEVEKLNYPFSFDPKTPLFLIGSCFSANIGEKFQKSCFDVCYNPLGTLYNPISVVESLELLQSEALIDESDLFFDGELWGCFNFSTLFSSPNKEEALELMNSALREGREALKKSKVIFITLGTSSGFNHIESGKIVANCHKFPSRYFQREMIPFSKSAEFMFRHLSGDFYRDKQVVLSVSPVRHAKDGFVQNSVSKSNLILCCNELCSSLENVSYFPSYEIFMDELRDYRFYDKDMVHPSSLAVDIIWERVKEAFLSKEGAEMVVQLDKVVKEREHRPRQAESESYKLFREKLNRKIESMEQLLGRKI